MSDCETLLKQTAQMLGCKIWVCEKVGRRMSYLPPLKAGEDKYIEPQIICEDEKFALLGECQEVNEKMRSQGMKVIMCVRRHFDENN
ncbi:hypothetical protein [Coprothermobacter platensis]|jgi:predicted peroxiredoxin|uniref:hypothetical protein n=1 Tax=Coprothermobacter platensis TaxID=108819 RepID=UPI00037834C6|nr:hypothetical protein [Coprothermobacter platensis]